MRKKQVKSGDLSWLSQIADRGPTLNDTHPIWVRHVELHSDAPVSPPHRHAYCEFELLARGEILQHVEQEQVHRKPGSFFFAGPGVPHWSTVVAYPVNVYIIYFKPWVLMGNGTGWTPGRFYGAAQRGRPLRSASSSLLRT